MSTRGARVVRGLIVAVVCLFVALAGHLAAGGRVGAVGFALAFAFASLVSIAAAGRTVSRLRTALAVLVSQSIFHLLLGVGGGPASGSPANPPRTMLGMAAGQVPTNVPGLPAMAPVSGMQDSAWMWAAHGLAAAITILALVRGEQTFWRLAGWVAYSVKRVLRPPRPVTVGVAVLSPAVLAVAARPARFLISGTRHRGPPERIASV